MLKKIFSDIHFYEKVNLNGGYMLSTWPAAKQGHYVHLIFPIIGLNNMNEN